MTGQPSLLPINNSYRKEDFDAFPLEKLPANEALPSADPADGFVKNIALEGVHTPIQAAVLTDGSMIVLAGRRRIKACRKLGMTTIPTRVYYDVSPDDAYAMIASDNNQRTDNPIADVEAIMYFRNQGITDECQLALVTGIPIQTLRARMTLLNLKSELRSAVRDGKMTMNAAEEAAKLPEARQDVLVKKLDTQKKISSGDVRKARQVETHVRTEAFNKSLPLPAIPAPAARLWVVVCPDGRVAGPTEVKAELDGIEGKRYYLTEA